MGLRASRFSILNQSSDIERLLLLTEMEVIVAFLQLFLNASLRLPSSQTLIGHGFWVMMQCFDIDRPPFRIAKRAHSIPIFKSQSIITSTQSSLRTMCMVLNRINLIVYLQFVKWLPPQHSFHYQTYLKWIFCLSVKSLKSVSLWILSFEAVSNRFRLLFS